MPVLQEHQDGNLYIVESDVNFDEPVRVIIWWPLGLKAADFKRNWGEGKIGQVLRYSGLNGVYTDQAGLQYRLENGGQTTPTYLERQAIPRPSVKVETRWNRGRWEKRLKRGWVAA